MKFHLIARHYDTGKCITKTVEAESVEAAIRLVSESLLEMGYYVATVKIA